MFLGHTPHNDSGFQRIAILKTDFDKFGDRLFGLRDLHQTLGRWLLRGVPPSHFICLEGSEDVLKPSAVDRSGWDLLLLASAQAQRQSSDFMRLLFLFLFGSLSLSLSLPSFLPFGGRK